MREKTIDCSKLDLISYEKFLNAKTSPFYNIQNRKITINEFEIKPIELKEIEKNEEHLFDYQKFILNLAIRKKKYAIWADCGLGKTAIFLAWVRRLAKISENQKILIISPLMVINQTIEEEKKFYRDRLIDDIHNLKIEDWLKSDSKIGITNIDKFYKNHNFQDKIFGVVLDESSILKNADGKTRNSLIENFKGVPFKLCCSATPAPNDREEYANHATFLDYTRSNNEFFSRFFVNKDNGWIIKPHGKEAFYSYLSEWGVYLRNPEKYGFENNLKILPKPDYNIFDVSWTPGQEKEIQEKNVFGGSLDALSKKMFYLKLSKGFIDFNGQKKFVETNKTKEIIKILEKNKNTKTIIWVTFNEEERILLKALKNISLPALSISGQTDEEERVRIIENFRDSGINILISKTKLLGFGLNFPYVNTHIFSGMTDSYEQFYQAIKRSYRYGAKGKLMVYIPTTPAEKKILNNVLRKKDEFDFDSEKQEKFFIDDLRGELSDFFKRPFETLKVEIMEKKKYSESKNWKLFNGDSIKVLREMDKESVDFSVFSPPFASLFTYSNSISDMGNCGDGNDEFNLHFEFFLSGLFDIMKKGRIVCCHLSQLATLKGRDGFVGLKDFRGKIIELFQISGFKYFSEWVIPKNPQMQAIKEKVRSLSFAQLESDRLGSKSGLNDMILVFKKPGDADVKLINDDTAPTRDEWIEWACGVWPGIRESDTLNVRGTKNAEDVKHICPMNLEVIRRCIRMYSTKGELVLDPFNGVGSVGVVSLQLGRKYVGIELKKEYFEEAERNLTGANIFEKRPEINVRMAVSRIVKHDGFQNKLFEVKK